jgi:asparagine synthase (glutamine-hydrolysing)
VLYFVAFVWNELDAEACESSSRLRHHFLERSPGWLTVFDGAGLTVCCADSCPSSVSQIYPLADEHGVMVGRVFEKSLIHREQPGDEEPARVTFDARKTARIIDSRCRELIASYWGQYVAFVKGDEPTHCWILRDPSGKQPCQHARLQGVDVYFVRLQDLERVAPISLSLNRDYVIGYLLFDSVCVRETGVKEVSTVLPGECIEHHGDNRSELMYWNPLSIAATDIVQDFDEAVQLTRRTVRACVHAWRSCFDGIVLKLSGGLDSSIVLACLSENLHRQRVMCINYFDTNGANSDERRFARRAAERAGCMLLEMEVDADFSLEPASRMPRTLFPFPWTYNVEKARTTNEMLLARRISGEFNGDGGDEVFYQGGLLPGAVDYAWLNGLRPGLISAALDDAILDQLSLWQVLRSVWHYAVRKHPWHVRDLVDHDHQPLMVPAVREEARARRAVWHPLFRDQVELPPGKVGHAYLLTLGASNAYVPTGFEHVPVRVAPLMSQPVVELSLRTPLHVMRTGARDRAVARRAFAADLPPEIIARKSKCTGNSSMEDVIANNINFVRELLLDGYLVSERIVDGEQLRRFLTGEFTGSKSGVMEICTYLCVEAWARSWSESRARAAA